MIEKYFEEELRYLYDSGREFAKEHPDRARFLNVDAVGDRDPYVERLFEGFAFLAARIREKLDDSLPELTEGLINLMWPQFLQEIPSTAIIQFRPRPGILHETKVLPCGSEVLSGPVGTESVSCRFRTTLDINLNPVTVRAVEKVSNSRGTASLKIRIDIDPKASWENLKLSPLRLYLHCERPTALTLREFLVSRIIDANISVNNGQSIVNCDPSEVCTPAGFAPEESLLPGDNRCFGASALLMEYFIYPEKFLFVDLWGLDRVVATDNPPTTLTYTLTFDSDPGPDIRVAPENFRLFCSPAVNLYQADIEPVSHTGTKEEYCLSADASHPDSTTVHSLISVVGIDRITGQRCVYEPLYTFKNVGLKNGRTFASRRGLSAGGKRRQYLVLGGDSLDGTELRQQNLTIEAWCSNNILPREEVAEGGINRGGRDFPDYAMVTNITRPTLPCSPPDSDEFLWVFLSHQGSNYMTLGTAETLKAFLRLYDWSNDPGNAKRVESISDVTVHPAEKIMGQGIVRGVRFDVSISAGQFLSRGDIRLFGEVLAAFLSQYISINSFLDMSLILKPSGETIQFNAQAGKQWLI